MLPLTQQGKLDLLHPFVEWFISVFFFPIVIFGVVARKKMVVIKKYLLNLQV
jgi:hypothetical protein